MSASSRLLMFSLEDDEAEFEVGLIQLWIGKGACCKWKVASCQLRLVGVSGSDLVTVSACRLSTALVQLGGQRFPFFQVLTRLYVTRFVM